MAHVVITREAAETDGKLPALCMCCGAPATVWVTRRLMLKPPRFNQVELAEIAIFKAVHALATSDYVHLRTSFCEKHRHYWRIKAIVLFGGMVMFFAAMFLALVFAVAGAVINPREPNKVLVAIAVMSAILGFVGWTIPLLIFCRKPICAFGMEQGLIIVDNVGDAYAKAVKATGPPAPPAP